MNHYGFQNKTWQGTRKVLTTLHAFVSDFFLQTEPIHSVLLLFIELTIPFSFPLAILFNCCNIALFQHGISVPA